MASSIANTDNSIQYYYIIHLFAQLNGIAM